MPKAILFLILKLFHSLTNWPSSQTKLSFKSMKLTWNGVLVGQSMLIDKSQTFLFMFAELLMKEIKYRELLGDNRIGTNSYPLMFTNCDEHFS